MTTFKDGPAKGQTLMLKRGPYYLRVTMAKDTLEKFDALDQPDDTAREGEIIFAYRAVQINHAPPVVHINRGGGKGGFYVCGEYELNPEQPPDEVMRDNAKWREWCERNKP